MKLLSNVKVFTTKLRGIPRFKSNPQSVIFLLIYFNGKYMGQVVKIQPCIAEFSTHIHLALRDIHFTQKLDQNKFLGTYSPSR